MQRQALGLPQLHHWKRLLKFGANYKAYLCSSFLGQMGTSELQFRVVILLHGNSRWVTTVHDSYFFKWL